MDWEWITHPRLETTSYGQAFLSWRSEVRTWGGAVEAFFGEKLSFEHLPHTYEFRGLEQSSASCGLVDYFLSPMNFFLFWDKVTLCSPHWPETRYIHQGGHKIPEIHLPLPPKQQDYVCALPCLAIHMHFKQVIKNIYRLYIYDFSSFAVLFWINILRLICHLKMNLGNFYCCKFKII